MECTPEEALPKDWQSDARHSRAAARTWINEAQSLLLSVPSAVVPYARNVLLNPRHPDAPDAQITLEVPFAFDERLL